jgi:2-amino-4-hydroxy-6-hydroxymethyldihydropteridine diphosphokinase
MADPPSWSSETPCAIALGSNLGDSLKTLEAALQHLAQTPGITLLRVSPWYKTRPLGPAQPDYLNGCALLGVTLSPQALLTTLLAIEDQFGRVREERWGPRTLDLDLLLYGDLVLQTPDLIIPHPRLAERAFVLVPLADIAPDLSDPRSGLTISSLLDQVDKTGVELLTSAAG